MADRDYGYPHPDDLTPEVLELLRQDEQIEEDRNHTLTVSLPWKTAERIQIMLIVMAGRGDEGLPYSKEMWDEAADEFTQAMCSAAETGARCQVQALLEEAVRERDRCHRDLEFSRAYDWASKVRAYEQVLVLLTPTAPTIR